MVQIFSTVLLAAAIGQAAADIFNKCNNEQAGFKSFSRDDALTLITNFCNDKAWGSASMQGNFNGVNYALEANWAPTSQSSAGWPWPGATCPETTTEFNWDYQSCYDTFLSAIDNCDTGETALTTKWGNDMLVTNADGTCLRISIAGMDPADSPVPVYPSALAYWVVVTLTLTPTPNPTPTPTPGPASAFFPTTAWQNVTTPAWQNVTTPAATTTPAGTARYITW